jgi:hypothetical protein
MRNAAGSLSAMFVFVTVSGFMMTGCTTTPAVRDVDVDLPVAEHRIYVEVPGRTAMSAEDLRRSYYEGRRTLSHIRARCVTTPSPAGSCARTTDVRITAVEGAKYVEADDSPSRPQLIAWLENLGSATTFDGIKPIAEARYALVVDTRPNVNAAILRVEFPGERAARGTAAGVTPYGNVYRCHNYGRRLISDADYQVCSPRRDAGVLRAPSGLRSIASLTSMATWTSALSYDDPKWFSCASGCCSSSATIALY